MAPQSSQPLSARSRIPTIIAACGVAVALSACGGADPETSGPSEPAPVSSTSEQGVPPTASTDTLPQSSVGQAFRNGPFRISVVGVESGTDEIDLDGPDIDGIPPIRSVNGKFVRVYVTVKNVGSQPATFWGIGSTLAASGKEYLASGPYLVGGEDQGLWKEQQPGSVTRGWIAFDVPNSVTKLEAVNIQSDPDRSTNSLPTRVDLAEVNG